MPEPKYIIFGVVLAYRFGYNFVMKTKIAIYPGTFDPITFGHLDLVKRALNLFDHIVVAVAAKEEKSPLFSLDERVNLARTVLKDFDHVEVVGFKNLLVDFAKEQHAKIILRGIRMISDFDYEFQLAGVNRLLSPDIETVFLRPDDKYSYVSSSIVRDIASSHGDVSYFVPPVIANALKEKFA